jgi:maltose O-acetyltransferase
LIDLQEIRIDKVQTYDSVALTEIAFAAKRHWRYPEHYYELWQDELTISDDYISQNIVYKLSYLDSVIGFYSIIENETDIYSGDIFIKKGFWLEHMFINPDYHRNGIGRIMINHVKHIAENNGISSLMIFADPFAKGFYDKIGAVYLSKSKSSIPGRLIPIHELAI